MAERIITSRVYSVSQRILDLPTTLQKRFVSFRVSLTREAWPAGVEYILPNGVVLQNTALVLTFQRSNDNGVTWEDAGGTTFVGGVRLDRQGQPVLTDSIEFALRDANDVPITQTADLRLVADILVSLRTAVTLTATEPA